jgi:hypothetical protein
MTPERYTEDNVPAPKPATDHHYELVLANERKRRMRTVTRNIVIAAASLALIGGATTATIGIASAETPAPVVEVVETSAPVEPRVLNVPEVVVEAPAPAPVEAAVPVPEPVVEEPVIEPAPEPAPAPAPAPVPEGGVYDPETDSMAHTICEVTAEGVQIPCQ